MPTGELPKVLEIESMVARNVAGLLVCMADALEALSASPLVADEEAVVRALIATDRGSDMSDRKWAELWPQIDREKSRHYLAAEHLFASGVIERRGDVQAEALEAWADETEEYYPTEVFPKPTDEQYAALATALARANLTLDRFSADLMRRAAGLARAATLRTPTPEAPNEGND